MDATINKIASLWKAIEDTNVNLNKCHKVIGKKRNQDTLKTALKGIFKKRTPMTRLNNQGGNESLLFTAVALLRKIESQSASQNIQKRKALSEELLARAQDIYRVAHYSDLDDSALTPRQKSTETVHKHHATFRLNHKRQHDRIRNSSDFLIPLTPENKYPPKQKVTISPVIEVPNGHTKYLRNQTIDDSRFQYKNNTHLKETTSHRHGSSVGRTVRVRRCNSLRRLRRSLEARDTRLLILGRALTTLTALCSQSQQAFLIMMQEFARQINQTALLLGLDPHSISVSEDNGTLGASLCPWFEALYVLTRNIKQQVTRLVAPHNNNNNNKINTSLTSTNSLQDRIVTILDSMQSNLLTVSTPARRSKF